MSDWSSYQGMAMRGGGIDMDSLQGSIMQPADLDSLQGMSLRDIESNQGEMMMSEQNVILSAVAEAIEQLRAAGNDMEEKERIAMQLSQLAEASTDARAAIGYHSQAIPLLVGLLRNGTLMGRTHAAAILGALSEEDELRVKVLLGGCTPPLLALLRNGPKDSQIVAAEALFAVSKAVPEKDHVGTRIFATEGVVPALLDQLQPEVGIHPDVLGLLTGALRNLCTSLPVFWATVMVGGGIEIFARMLKVGRPPAQENAAALLTNFMMSTEVIPSKVGKSKGGKVPAKKGQEEGFLAERAEIVAQAGAVGPLLALIEPGRDVGVRTEAAGALRALSGGNRKAREQIAGAGGVGVLIGATVAPSAEMMQTGHAQMLQENAIGALANVAGGKAQLVRFLAKNIAGAGTEQELADNVGALAYALMVMDEEEGEGGDEKSKIDAAAIEKSLVKCLSPKASILVQERAIEALSSLYGNEIISQALPNAEGKKMLVGLITSSAPEMQSELVRALLDVCVKGVDLWTALNGRDGVLQMVGLLGLSTEDQQECACSLLYILSSEVEDCKWSITAAGGIPPLVAVLSSGTIKAREDAAAVLGNLCSYSEDIRACVETADAIPALLHLLGGGSARGQAIAARTLTRLVSGANAGAAIMGHLTGILIAEMPESKVHVLRVLGHLLAESQDVAFEGSASNEALQTLVALLESDKAESQESAAAVLANLFASREDLRESRAAIEAIPPLVRLVDYGSEQTAMQAARALAAIFCSIDTNVEAVQAARDGIFPLVKLAKSSTTAVAEVATTALANLLANEELAQYAPANEVVFPLSRLLREGTAQGKEHAAGALAHLLHSRPLTEDLAESIQQCSTVLALVALLATSTEEEATVASLEALASLARAKLGRGFTRPPLHVLSEVPYSIGPLVNILAAGTPSMQEKAIEVLSRLCKDQPVVLGDMIAGTDGCIAMLAARIINAASLEVKVGGTALLICAAKEHRESTMHALIQAGAFTVLVSCLVDMLTIRNLDEIDMGGDSSAATLVHSVALWLLAVVALYTEEAKSVIAQAGAVETLIEKVAVFSPNAMRPDAGTAGDESGGTWVSALVLAILFSAPDVARSPSALKAIVPLVNLLKSQDPSERFFSSQAVASLVMCRDSATLLAVADAGAIGELLLILARPEDDISNLLALAEDFSLPACPEQLALETLFSCEAVCQEGNGLGLGFISQLIDLLKPGPDRPHGPPVALNLLTRLATSGKQNKIILAKAGVLEAVSVVLSIGPQESVEEAAVNLLRIMFKEEDLKTHPAASRATEQLVAVLRLGCRNSRQLAVQALETLFSVDAIRGSETALQSIAPSLDVLSSGTDLEQRAAAAMFTRLAFRNAPKFMGAADATGKSILDILSKLIATDGTSWELKEECLNLLKTLFAYGKVRNSGVATQMIGPLVALLSVGRPAMQLRATQALDALMDNEQQTDNVASSGAVAPLVNLLDGDNHTLHAAVASALFKLAKDRRQCKLDMAGASVLERIIGILPNAPLPLTASFAELLRILTNNTIISTSPAAGLIVTPVFSMLSQPDLNANAQTSALQALVNVLEKPGRMGTLELDPQQSLESLLPLLSSPSLIVQQLAAGLVAHLLSQESFHRDPMTALAAAPLVKLLLCDLESLKVEGLKGLEFVSRDWPNSIVDAGGIEELSRLVATAPHPMWQHAASVLANVIQARDKYMSRVPIPVLVRLLVCNSTVVQNVALSGLLALERDDPSCAETMAQMGVVEALLEMLKTHQAEEASARLLEVIFNNHKVRESPVALRAIAPLAAYLVDPESRDTSAKLLAALALGDIFQESALLKNADLSPACRALVTLMSDSVSEDLQMVALCGLQNLVANSRPNKRAVADAGGMKILFEMLGSNNPDIISQAANLIRLLLNNHTIQEFATPELVSSLAAVVEREIWKTASTNEEILGCIESLLTKFSRLRFADCGTAMIPTLIGALKVGSERAQETALNIMWILRQGWSQSQEIARLQSIAMGDSIPVLQLMLRSGPLKLYEKSETLLFVLPGSLTITLKRASNLKLGMGGTNAFCKVTLGDTQPRTTKVISNSTEPEWNQSFTWPLEAPPKGQTLMISCKNKGTLGMSNLGKVTIQIDRVVALGTVSGTYAFTGESNKDGSQRTIDVEFCWSNR